MAYLRALLVRNTRDPWRSLFDLRQANPLLSVNSARLADRHRLAAIARRNFLRDRRFLHFRYWQYNNSLGTPKQIHLPAVAWVLHCVWVPFADPRDAGVYRSIRATVRRTYDLWRRYLHGCARHASWNARSLCRVCSWCCDCNHQHRGGAARALVGGSSRSSRGLLSRASDRWLVRQQLYREAQRTGSRATLHCLQY